MNAPTGISFADALTLVRAAAAERRLASQRVPLHLARGRVLHDAVAAPIDLPPFDNSAMDGFALRGADLSATEVTMLQLLGDQFAGTDRGLSVGPGECVRITTGAPLPLGADTVVIKEHAQVEGRQARLQPGTMTGANVRRAGEDVRAGHSVARVGSTLGSATLGLLAALGLSELVVSTLPSVAVFTSGDELRPAGASLAPGEIYDSNRILLQALLAEQGISTLSWPALPDDEARIESALHDAAQAYNLIITCGGVSAGERDLLPALLARHGQVRFWKVMMRPGMPVLFGDWGQALLIGLPGNPVSVLATFRRLVVPLLDAMQGRVDSAPSLRARLRTAVSKNHARLEFRRGCLSCDAKGQLWVEPHPAAGSHQQRGAAESNALLVLPEDARHLPPDELVEVEPYGAILRA